MTSNIDSRELRSNGFKALRAFSILGLLALSFSVSAQTTNTQSTAAPSTVGTSMPAN